MPLAPRPRRPLSSSPPDHHTGTAAENPRRAGHPPTVRSVMSGRLPGPACAMDPPTTPSQAWSSRSSFSTRSTSLAASGCVAVVLTPSAIAALTTSTSGTPSRCDSWTSVMGFLSPIGFRSRGYRRSEGSVTCASVREMTLARTVKGPLRALRMTSRRKLVTGAGAVSEPKSGERRCKPRRAGLAPSRGRESRSPVDRFPRPAPRYQRRLATPLLGHVVAWRRKDA